MEAGFSTPRGTVARLRSVHRRFVAVLSSLLVVAAVTTPAPAAAATCSAAELVPQVRGHSINQGLGSYKDLVRGKDIVFRLFLSRPACAEGTTQSVSLTGATLAVKSGVTTLLSIPAPTNSLTPPPLLAYHSAAPAIPDSTGDPKWLVNGRQLANVAPATSVPLTFEVTLSYANSAGGSGTTLPITTSNGALMAKTLLPATTPMRILAIPMGDATKTVSSQFSGNAKMATLDGFAVLGRTFPLANGVGDLTTDLGAGSASPGMLYHLNTNTQVNVKPYMNSSGIFCDNGNALESRIAPQLENHLKQYNTANPLSKSADHVLGVIDQAISSSCAEGFALVNSKFAYVRARYHVNSTTGAVTPTMTGALMGMEEAHNFGAVPCGASTSNCPADRDNQGDAYHSQNPWAHSTDRADYPDVAYNLLAPTAKGQPVADDRNVMQYAAQPTGTWLNTNTFLQKEDWALLICKLGGPATPDCALPVDASAAGVGAQPTTTIVGTTDGTKGGTDVYDSYADQPGAVDQPGSSTIHLVQKNASGGVVRSNPVRLVDDGGEGHHGSEPESHAETKVFAVSFATHPDAAKLELVNTATNAILYERTKSGGGPRNVHTSVTRTGGSSTGCGTTCPAPSEMSSRSEFGAAAKTIDFEVNPLTEEPYSAGDTVNLQYLASHGVTFADDAATTPKIIGDCTAGHNPCRFPPATPTQSGRFALWNSPDTLPVGPIDPVPDSRGVPLTVNLVDPAQRVGLHIGNDDTGTTTATLSAYDAAGELIKAVTKTAFGAGSTTFVGIDAGQPSIASIVLDYGQSPLGEEIDDLIIERPGGPPTTDTYRAVVTAEDDDPENLRAAFFAKCPRANEVLDSGVRPSSISGQEGTFVYEFDATQVCRNGSTTTILVRLNDGYNQTGFHEINVNAASSTRPIAVIDNPNAEASAYSVLQHEPITLSGQGWDAQEGVLPGSHLTWTVTGPAGVVSDGEHGNTLTIAPPSGGTFTPGPHTATLTVKNSAGLESSTTTTFQVLEDKDNDGIELAAEGCYRGSDTDPNDAFGDFDNDGVANQQDEAPCSPRTAYEGVADFDPNTLNYPSQGGSVSVTMKVQLRYRDLAQVAGSTVRITRLGGRSVPANDPRFAATAWTISKAGGVTEATAKLDRQAIIDYLCPAPSNCQTNQTVFITIAGNAPAGGGRPAFSFTATDSFAVQKS